MLVPRASIRYLPNRSCLPYLVRKESIISQLRISTSSLFIPSMITQKRDRHCKYLTTYTDQTRMPYNSINSPTLAFCFSSSSQGLSAGTLGKLTGRGSPCGTVGKEEGL
jgi:hypothetical protein